VTLSPTELALAWYWTEPPEGWVYGHGDICADVPYVVRDAITRQILVEPVLAVCTEHPCDTANDPSARVGFARAFYLDEALEQNSRLWNLLPDVAAGRHLDFWLLPALPTLWDADILVDLRDRFSVSQAEALRATRLAGLHEPYERAFAWRLMLRAGRAQPPHPVAPFARLRQLSSGAPAAIEAFLDLPLGAGEVRISVHRPPRGSLTHYRREAAQQDWWKAEWHGLTATAGYGRSPERASRALVRAVRRLVAELPDLSEERAAVVWAQLEKAGIASA
jgi:hypothetical protein